MTNTITTAPADVEAQCRVFAEWYATPNALKAITLAEAGEVSWGDIYKVFCQALDAGVKAVRET